MSIFDSIHLAWWKRRALNTFVSGQHEAALKYFSLIKNRWPDFPGIDYNLGLTALALGRFQQAEAYLLDARKHDSSYAVLRALADLYYFSGDRKTAITSYKEAKREVPQAKEKKMIEKRIATCGDAVKYRLAQQGWEAFNRAVEMEKQGKKDEAATLYEEALRMDETNFIAANNLGGYCMNQLSDYPRALSFFRAADALADHPVVKTNIAKLQQLLEAS